MEFCHCGSLKVNGNCTNRKCRGHNKRSEMVTFEQMNYIKGLLREMDVTMDIDFKTLTKIQASHLIEELVDEKYKRL